MLNANIFDASSRSGSSDFLSGGDLIGTIKKGIAQTYVALRDICAIIMLAGLIFTGIRVLVTSNIPTKMSTWKQLLQDWLIGLILLVFSHVIMVFVFYVSDTITNALKSGLIGFGEMNCQLVLKCLKSLNAAEEIICICMLGYLIYLTVIFLISYLRRLLWICVLIVIAPVVSVMYSFGTTKSIYSNWLRDFMMMVFIQPFHLIIYYTLFSVPLNMASGGSGFDLTGSNTLTMIYALAAMSFIKKAEKYLTALFGFDKGLAAHATAESGRKSLQKAAVVVGTVAATAATVATGGAGAGLGAAAKGALKSLGTAAKSTFEDGVFAKDAPPIDENMEMLGQGDYDENYLSEADDKINIGQGYARSNAIAAIDDSASAEELSDAKELDKLNEIADTNNKEVHIDELPESNNSGNNKMDAANVIINADSIRLNGSGIGTNSDGQSSNGKEKDRINSTNEARQNLNQQKANFNDDRFEIDDKEKYSALKQILSAPRVNTGRFMGVMTGQKGAIEALSEARSDAAQLFKNTKLGELYNKTNFAKNLDTEPFKQIGNIFKQMEKNGDLHKIHKAFRELDDTFDYKGGGEWKEASDLRQTRLKQKNEEQIEATLENKNNINLIAQLGNIKDKVKAENKDKSDAWINNETEKRAKEKLQSLAKAYVPEGVTDVSKMYHLGEVAKANGYSPKQAITHDRLSTANDKEWEKFNINEQNIINVSQDYKVSQSSQEQKVTSVAQAIPNARQYYDKGYHNMKDIQRLDTMSNKLNITPELSMKIDQALRKKGGDISIKNVSGLSADQQRQLEANVRKITDGYKSSIGDLDGKRKNK